MNDEILKMLEEYRKDDYHIRESSSTMSVYKKELCLKEGWERYNFHDDQEQILKLVNGLHNKVKEYDIFIIWLLNSGIIDENVLDVFQDILKYDNPIVKMIHKSIGLSGRGHYEYSNQIYKDLVDNGIIKGDINEDITNTD